MLYLIMIAVKSSDGNPVLVCGFAESECSWIRGLHPTSRTMRVRSLNNVRLHSVQKSSNFPKTCNRKDFSAYKLEELGTACVELLA